ncbi:hypothetical protein L6164_037215 [Bauhinia variegata]|uniref:Uncharacterized protein n=1 Tax=Bauhinia variegata TaxID=167791 RepID=A0ACB9KJD9_BAUVA|nr:hypothetical protein L6164_037215 [Bauhinia variegata]
MRNLGQKWVISLVTLLLALCTPYSDAYTETANKVKSAVFYSPKVELSPGISSNKFYYDVKFPEGHVALKSFNGEVVDEEGNSVPLYEVYLHHWLVDRYHQPINSSSTEDIVLVRNAGVCQGDTLSQYFGIGSETRKTATYIPDPFGVEIGNPVEIPAGYEEKWMINLHAIDTRGVEDRRGCTECRCNLYNVTTDGDGQPLPPSYKGGLQCCTDNAQCRLKEGYKGYNRTVYLKYTVEWVDWDYSIIPVKIYIPDVTDTVKISNGPNGLNVTHNCQIEYDIDRCNTTEKHDGGCIDVRKTSFPMIKGGHVIYGVAHQHAGGLGSTLYGQDGRIICTSLPKYGTGKQAGNEKGYIVGMTTCYPQPGSVKIMDGESLTLISDYSNSEPHTGLMGLFYFLVAERL